MNTRKLLAALMAIIVCFAVPMTALAAVSSNRDVQLFDVNDESSTDESLTEEPTEAPTVEPTEKPTDATTEAPTEELDKSDVIALLIKFLSSIKLDEVKDSLNDINEALGLPRIENFTDIAAYADALYEKLEDMGLSYDDIINSVTSSDFIQWLNGLLFGGKDDATTEKTTSALDADEDDDSNIPDTGVTYAATGAAVAALAVSAGIVVVLKRREHEAE